MISYVGNNYIVLWHEKISLLKVYRDNHHLQLKTLGGVAFAFKTLQTLSQHLHFGK